MEADDPQTLDIEPEQKTEDDAASESGSTAGDESGDGGRYRSTIAFPYNSLKDAEQIADRLQNAWGGEASPEQLAASFGTMPSKGAFRMKISAARLFGLVSVSRNKLTLTQLGRQIIDPQARTGARVEAFQKVPLFQEILEAYRGHLLPPDAALEKKMADLGVSPKQTAKARQAFQRSAQHAGFFQHGARRLVPPATHLAESPETPETPERLPKDPPPVTTTNASLQGPVPAPVQALWLALLRDGRTWSAEETQKFVESARSLYENLSER